MATASLQPGYNFSPAAPAYVYYATTGAAPPFPIKVALADAFASAPDAAALARVATTPFALQPPTGVPNAVAVAQNGPLWTFDGSAVRASLHDGLRTLLEAIEPFLKPGRLPLVRWALAQMLPQTFAETLFVRYGLDPANRCVDLLPGMKLRIDWAVHQSVDPEQPALNGFVGTGSTRVAVVQVPTAAVQAPSTGPGLALDPFLGLLQNMTVAAPSGGGAGVFDLQPAMPYWRLHYPKQIQASDGTGFAGTRENATLIGAPSYVALGKASDQYVGDGTVPSTAASVFLRGRAALTPEIGVAIQGVMEDVPLGTTVRDLLSRFAPTPFLPTGGKALLDTASFNRLSQTLTGWQLGNASFAQIGFGGSQYTCYGDALDSFDLPVLGGDVLAINFPSPG